MALKIGELAKATNLPATTIRFYERCGLISKPPRSDSGYRYYSEAAIQEIRFIKNSHALGFTMQEIGVLLEARTNDRMHEMLQRYAADKLACITDQINQLKQAARILGKWRNHSCHRPYEGSACALLGLLEKTDFLLGEEGR